MKKIGKKNSAKKGKIPQLFATAVKMSRNIKAEQTNDIIDCVDKFGSYENYREAVVNMEGLIGGLRTRKLDKSCFRHVGKRSEALTAGKF
jgi:hypothetical protein